MINITLPDGSRREFDNPETVGDVAASIGAGLAKAALAQAQAAKADMDKVKSAMEALFSAMRASQLLRSDPALATLSDQMLLSGGFVDQNAAPIVPDATGLPPAAPPPVSTNPLTPDNPATGAAAGLSVAPPA